MTDKPYNLTLYQAPWGPEFVTDLPVADLRDALDAVADAHRQHGAFKFRVVHRDTADCLLDGEIHPTPNADA